MSSGTDQESPGYDVAVVGIALHLPDAATPEQYWRNLRGGVESIRPLTESELDQAGVSPSLRARPNYVKRGVVLEGMENFDATFFGFSPKDAAITDPQHRHFLECAWQALEDAGHPPETFAGSIGVFAGSGMAAYMAFNLLTNKKLVEEVGLFLLRHTGNDKDFLATRVSYSLDLRGPSINVQTACSTSLVAIHLACQSLLSGECDMALAGGVSIHLPHRTGYLFHENEILSPDGRCRAFDARSKGTVFGSGAGIVVLRRLDEALKDGDHVYAVIRGSAINNDGSLKVGYLAPSVDGQAEAIRQAIGIAGISADTIGYVETHGTGTAVGDPIEIAALTQAFRASTDARGFCGVGSVKPNIGHTDTAAGVASFIKVALALQKGELPPSLHFEGPNPEIDFASSPFYVNAALKPWTSGATPRRAGVSSLGVGGTNAHVVLEEAPAATPSARTRPWSLIVVSARTQTALEAGAKNLRAHLVAHPEVELGDVAWTLQVGRRAFAWRRVFVARDRDELLALLDKPEPARSALNQAGNDAPGVAFLLPGGGAQHPAMGRGLYEDEPVYAAEVDACLALVERDDALGGRGLAATLRRVLFPTEQAVEWARTELQRPSVQLPALFVTEYALARLWMAHGVAPRALAGHSMGENTAACLAGVLSLRDALGLVALRGRLFETVPAGGMLSVELGAEDLRPLLGEDLALAADNAPGLSVASGSVEAIERLQKDLAARGVESSRVHIAIAAHSALVESILPAFRAYLRSITLSAPKIPFVSNLTGTWITPAEACDPEYWVKHLRNTVRYSACVRTLLAEKKLALIEVGPGTTLSSLARQHGDAALARSVLSSMRHRDDATPDVAFFRLVLGKLWTLGVKPDWKALAREPRRRVPLPTYPFERQRFWIEPGLTLASSAGAPDALEKLADTEQWFHSLHWRRAPLATRSEAPVARSEAPVTRSEAPVTRHENIDSERWLLFADGGGLADSLATRLRARGDSVVVVREGEFFEKVDDALYTVVPQEREHYAWLWEDLAARSLVPTRIVHLALATQSEETAVTTTFFHYVQERGFYSLLFLGQALAASPLDHGVRLAVVTNGMQSVAGETLIHPAKALVLGPCRVMPKEIPQLACVSLDVDLPSHAHANGSADAALASIAERIVAEMDGSFTDEVVAWRGGDRHVQELAPAQLTPSRLTPGTAANLPLRDAGVYWITGGLGGIGLALAEHLARTKHARLLLTSSSPFPARERWSAWLAEHAPSDATSTKIAKLMQLEALGAELLVLPADVANVEETRAAMDACLSRFGALHGVIHAAGRIEDALLPSKDPASVDRVFTPKVHGTLLLDELLDQVPLDFFLVFSSTSAVLGPPGQIDYAAANAFLVAFAEARTQRKPKQRTLALGWGMWQEVGMAARLARRDATHEPAALAQAGTRTNTAKQVSLHPLLGARVAEVGQEVVFAARLSARDMWVLDEHRLKDGTAVVPGTGQLALARAAARAVLGEGAVELADVVFLSPLAVDDVLGRDVRCRVRPAGTGSAFEIESRAPETDGEWELHAQGRFSRAASAAANFALDDVRRACDRPSPIGTRAPQESHVAFGPRWRILQEVTYGDRQALARFELAAEFAGDLATWPLHPAVLDVATGFALPLIDGPGGWNQQRFFAPLAYSRVRVHAPLPARGFSHVRLSGRASAQRELALFDVRIVDELGKVCVEVDEFTVRALSDTTALARSSRPAQQDAARLHRTPGHAASGGHVDAAFEELLRNAILPHEGVAAFERALSGAAGSNVFVSSVAPARLAERIARAGREDAEPREAFARPELASNFVAPRDAIETKLAQIWQELLGVDQVGVQDDFFELGGYSLIAVRLFARIKKEWQLEFPLSLLFEAPTVEGCAQRIREELGDAAPDATTDSAHFANGTPASAPPSRPKKLPFLVPLHAANSSQTTTKAPFFLVAGMYGNVMNLRHLAAHLGADQPVYGIQARGLDGKEAPHATFEEMAADYIKDVRTRQPHGPYLLGGYSGGGITAYEMAQQLRAAGEEVALLVFLDTPTPIEPRLTYAKRLRLARQRIARQGASFFTEAVRRKFDDKRRQLRLLVNKPMGRLRPYEYREANIESAFYAALELYQLAPYAGDIALFRPPLDEAYVLADDHVVNTEGSWVEPYNGWRPYVQGEITVTVVPGTHDNMVLEPNVRVLAGRLRAAIQAAQARGSESSAVDRPATVRA